MRHFLGYNNAFISYYLRQTQQIKQINLIFNYICVFIQHLRIYMYNCQIAFSPTVVTELFSKAIKFYLVDFPISFTLQN